MSDTHRRDLLVCVVGLVLLVTWEVAGLDIGLSRGFGDAAGFALQDDFFFKRVLHDGAHKLALALVALVVWQACRSRRPTPPPAASRAPSARAHRLYWLGVIVLTALLVPALKRVTDTSCPWDLTLFGGQMPYVPHWLVGVRDGGPGHCFPAGHPVNAFAFVGLYFQWRGHHPRRARAALLVVVIAGAVLGATQVMRGAHFASHVGWSACVCWTLAGSAAAIQTRLWSTARATATAVRPARTA